MTVENVCGMCLSMEVWSMKEDREGVLNDGCAQSAKCLLAVATFWGGEPERKEDVVMMFYVPRFVICSVIQLCPSTALIKK